MTILCRCIPCSLKEETSQYIPEKDHVGIALKRWAKKFNEEWERFDNPDWVAEKQLLEEERAHETWRKIEYLVRLGYPTSGGADKESDSD